MSSKRETPIKRRIKSASEKHADARTAFKIANTPHPSCPAYLRGAIRRGAPTCAVQEFAFGCTVADQLPYITWPPDCADELESAPHIIATMNLFNEANWGYPIGYTACVVPLSGDDGAPTELMLSRIADDTATKLDDAMKNTVFVLPAQRFVYGTLAMSRESNVAEFMVEYDRIAMCVGPPHRGRTHARDAQHRARYSTLHIMITAPGITKHLQTIPECPEGVYRDTVSCLAAPANYRLYNTMSVAASAPPVQTPVSQRASTLGTHDQASVMFAPADRGCTTIVRMDHFVACVSACEGARSYAIVVSSPQELHGDTEATQNTLALAVVEACDRLKAPQQNKLIDPLVPYDTEGDRSSTGIATRVLNWSGITSQSVQGTLDDCIAMVHLIADPESVYNASVAQLYITAWIMNRALGDSASSPAICISELVQKTKDVVMESVDNRLVPITIVGSILDAVLALP